MSKFDMTVVISSFNRDDKVGQTLERLFEADLSEFEKVEVIVIDDGSPRPVADVLSDIGDPPEKIKLRLIRQDNAGIGATRNRGFREATAPLVLFLDDDILIKPTTLSEFAAAHRKHPGGVIFGSYPFISHETESLRQFARGLYGYDRITETPFFEKVDAITSGLLCVDKAKLGSIDRFYSDDLAIPAAEEYEIIYRFHKMNVPIFNALHISAIHNHHLKLDWLVEQQFKYGMATAEAFQKYPEIIELQTFATLHAKLEAIGGPGFRNRVKAVFASAIGRSTTLALAKLLQRIGPARDLGRLFGILAGANYWAGYREGKNRFRKEYD